MLGRPGQDEAATYYFTYIDRVPGNDTERVFLFRAFWFARGFDSPLPSFDQEIAIGSAHAAHHVAILKERYLAPSAGPSASTFPAKLR